MTIRVGIPQQAEPFMQYTVNFLMREILAEDFIVEPRGTDYEITAGDNKTLLIESHFSQGDPVPTTATDLQTGLVRSGTCPVIYGRDEVIVSDDGIRIGLDVIASAFFMLGRWEEADCKVRDTHGRFPGNASLAYKAGFLQRPVVDEYIHLLTACIQHLWPAIVIQKRQGRVRVTCDVDEPYDRTLRSPLSVLRRVTGDILKRRSLSAASRSVAIASARARGNFSSDPNNTFDWLMDQCELSGNELTFYFLAGGRSKYDGCYSLQEPFIQHLLREASQRGHRLGTHGSYETWLDSRRLEDERIALGRALETCGHPVEVRQNRQHYLRWDAARTPLALEHAGFEEDSTGGYADAPGFRYGTGRPFLMWDVVNQRAINLLQRPLVAMEGSIIDYMQLGRSEEARALLLDLKNRTLASGSDFTFLWHNNRLIDEWDRAVFQELLS